MHDAYILLFAIIGIALLIVAPMSIRIVRPWEKGLIERLGKYQLTVDSGLNFVMPFLDKMIKVDMREQVVDVPPKRIIRRSRCGS